MSGMQTISLEVASAIVALSAGICWRLFSLLTKIEEKKADKESLTELKKEFDEKYKIIDSKLELKIDKVDDKVDKIRNSLHDLRNDLQRIAVFSSIKQKDDNPNS